MNINIPHGRRGRKLHGKTFKLQQETIDILQDAFDGWFPRKYKKTWDRFLYEIARTIIDSNKKNE
jgi:hypothetical protein